MGESLEVRFSYGDRQAFQELFERYEEELSDYARRLTSRHPVLGFEAGDLLSLLWMKLSRSTHVYDPQKKWVAWAVTAMKRLHIDILRQNRSEWSSRIEWDYSGGVEFEDYDYDQQRVRSSLSRAAYLWQEKIEIHEAMEEFKNIWYRLELEDRQVIQLYCQEGWSYRLVAEFTGSNIWTVRRRIMKLLATIREWWYDDGDEGQKEREEEGQEQYGQDGCDSDVVLSGRAVLADY